MLSAKRSTNLISIVSLTDNLFITFLNKYVYSLIFAYFFLFFFHIQYLLIKYFADHGICAIEHADFEGVERLSLVTGGEIVSTFDSPERVKLGYCDLYVFFQQQLGASCH